MVELGAVKPLLFIFSVGCLARTEGLLLCAELVVHVQSRAQHQAQVFGQPDVKAHVAVDPVAEHRVKLFVGLHVGVVGTRGEGIVLGILVDAVVPVPVDGHTLLRPHQRIGNGRYAVSRLRQVVALLAVVVDLHVERQPVGHLRTERCGEGLTVVARVGRDPVVPVVGERKSGRGPLAVAAVDRHEIIVGYARFEETFVPVAGDPGRGGVSPVLVLGPVLVIELPFEFRSP